MLEVIRVKGNLIRVRIVREGNKEMEGINLGFEGYRWF